MSAKTWFNIRASAESIDISIHDEIGSWGVSAKQFMADLKAHPANLPVNISLHSPGGEVLDGLAIYNTLKARTAPVSVKIEGLAASMASVIAMAGSTITMPRNAYLMIHNPSGMAFGDSADMRELADLLDKLQGSLVNAYESRTGLPRAEIISLMEAETWMDGDDALARGFIDSVTDEVALSASAFDKRRLVNMPKHATSPTATAEPVQPPAPDTAPLTPPIDADPAPAASEDPPSVVESDTETVELPLEVPVTTEEPTGDEPAADFVKLAAASLKKSRATRAQVEALETQLAHVISERDEYKATLTTLQTAHASLLSEVESLRAETKRLIAEEKTLATKAADLLTQRGLSPIALELLPPPSTEGANILDQFNAITDPAERQTFYNKNKDALRAARRAS